MEFEVHNFEDGDFRINLHGRFYDTLHILDARHIIVIDVDVKLSPLFDRKTSSKRDDVEAISQSLLSTVMIDSDPYCLVVTPSHWYMSIVPI